VKDDERGIEFTLRMVASIEANPDEDQISEESPLGAALMGAKPGESITYEAPVGPITYQITAISR
jgi:transcription elongation factor GreA